MAVLAFGLIVACGPKMPNYDYSKEVDPRVSEYVVGVDDGLNINIWKNEQLSTSVVVRPDGTITMPLVGDLVAKPASQRDRKASGRVRKAWSFRDHRRGNPGQ